MSPRPHSHLLVWQLAAHVVASLLLCQAVNAASEPPLAEPNRYTYTMGVIPLPVPRPELVPTLPKFKLVPRTAKSVPLGTVNLDDTPGLKEAPRLNAVALDKLAYIEEEYLISGAGERRGALGDSRSRQAAYATRILMRRPTDAFKFSGTIYLEPFDVGTDQAPVWARAWPHMIANGDVWVGVTVSGSTIEKSYRQFDASRYARLGVPDGLGLEIMAQLAGLLRSPSGPLALLGFDDKSAITPGLTKVYGIGWGPSGCTQREFINRGYHDSSRVVSGRPVIDGYFIGACAGEPIKVPRDAIIFQLLTESSYAQRVDAAAAAATRQSDMNLPKGRYRLFEVAGMSDSEYADLPAFSIALFQLGKTPSNAPNCTERPNVPGTDPFVRAALKWLDSSSRISGWPADGTALELSADQDLKRDEDGNALGGLRPYWMDVPTAAYSPGVAWPSTAIDTAVGAQNPCARLGTQRRFSQEKMMARYGSEAKYAEKVTDSLIRLVNAKLLLAVDADGVLERLKHETWNAESK